MKNCFIMNQNLEQLVEKRTEALVISEQKYRRIFEVSKDMILVTQLTAGSSTSTRPASRWWAQTAWNNNIEGRFFQDFLSGPERLACHLPAHRRPGFYFQ
jgi:hypothetical protein